MSSERRIGFLGPAGTFTEQALLTQPDLVGAVRLPYRTVPDVLDAVESNEVELGFVPIENSIEGTVNYTQDALVFDHELLIQREVVMDIEHCLLAPKGAQVGTIRTVHSMPVATAQCHEYLRTMLKQADVKVSNSTAEAAQTVAGLDDPTVAAVGPRAAATLYGLNVIAEHIADHGSNQTRFVLVGKGTIPQPTGHDRTALVVFQRADEPGSLISILQEFAARRINLSQLLSRPTKRGGLGDYCFIIYADSHIKVELMADVLRDLHAKQGAVKFLGSYPASDVHAHSAREHADARWREADDWINELRSRIAR